MTGTTKNVVFIHTVQGNVAAFTTLASELLPNQRPTHVVDESLLQDTIARGELTADITSRFRAAAERAVADGADIIMFTCSSVGPAADGLSAELGVPVLRVDEAMADRAISIGSTIGVAATLPTTLGPTSELIRGASSRAAKPVQIVTRLAEGAFQELQAGRGERHDQLVREALADLAGRVDVIVLAQASMARALGGADSVESGARSVPVLTSPRLGVERLRDTIAASV
ncbi:MAG: aspartate/glutamate racemase family protein [Chloroflexota bacterium]